MNTTPRDPVDSEPLRDIDLPPTDALLRDDVKRLGALVGDILAEQVSPDFLAEVGLADGTFSKMADHLDGDFGIGPAGEAEDGLKVELRPGFRHIEAAVARQPREHGVGKAERRGLASGGDMAQSSLPGPRREPRGLILSI